MARLRMIHTPVHASWLNQAEIFFSIIQKKVISPNDFASTTHLAATLLAFTDRYNQTARPFDWKFTAADLATLLSQITAHREPPSPSLPEVARQTPGELTGGNPISPSLGWLPVRLAGVRGSAVRHRRR
jgi:hypothetical protein